MPQRNRVQLPQVNQILGHSQRAFWLLSVDVLKYHPEANYQNMHILLHLHKALLLGVDFLILENFFLELTIHCDMQMLDSVLLYILNIQVEDYLDIYLISWSHFFSPLKQSFKRWLSFVRWSGNNDEICI